MSVAYDSMEYISASARSQAPHSSKIHCSDLNSERSSHFSRMTPGEAYRLLDNNEAEERRKSEKTKISDGRILLLPNLVLHSPSQCKYKSPYRPSEKMK